MILVVLAAGLGSRYGGDKQRDELGPGGEWITDLNLLDALAAGFRRAVMVCRPEHRAAIAARMAATAPAGMTIDCVGQEPPPPPRTRPWGTGHAVLAARPALDAPCCVINADDCYGPGTFVAAAELLAAASPTLGGLVTFRIGQCLSAAGSVSRGRCHVVDHELTGIEELGGLRRDGQRIVGRDAGGAEVVLADDTPVSLNTWCLHPAVLDRMAAQFAQWCAQGPGDSAEFQLPTALDEQLQEGSLRIRCAASPEPWYGVTTREDRAAVVAHLAQRLQGSDDRQPAR